MKKYTQEEFDALPIDENGIKQCPTGDYSQIKEFPDWCSFGEGCTFIDQCYFGEKCKFRELCKYKMVRGSCYVYIDRRGKKN